jgi:hypothetical protein
VVFQKYVNFYFICAAAKIKLIGIKEMAVIVPDTIQRGGVGVIKRLKSLVRQVRSETGKVVSGKNIAIRAKTKTAKRKPVNTLQTSKIKRLETVKLKSTGKKEEISSQQKIKAEGIKTAAQGRPQSTTKRAAVTSNVKTKQVQQFTTSIRAKAKAAAVRAKTEIKAKLVKGASEKQTNASFSLKTRLEKLNGDRLASIAISTRAETGDTLKTLGSQHGTAANLLQRSTDTIEGCNTRLGNADKDNKTQLSNKSRNQDNLNDAHLSDRERDRTSASGEIKDKSKLAEEAATEAGIALEKAKPMPEKIKNKIQDQKDLSSITPQAILDKRNAAESSGVVAADQNTKRSDTFSAAGGQITTRGKHDSARQSAAADVVTHSGQLSSATTRKDQNDKALEGVQKTHQADVDRMNNNANGAVATNKKNLDDANTSATGPRKTEQTNASTARSNKEGEIQPNATAISKKSAEINTARDNERNAKNDSDVKAGTVTTTNGTLNSQMSTLPSVKKNRDDALADAESKRPARQPSDQPNANRRGTILSTDIPAQQSIKSSAQKGLNDANAQLTKTTPLKDANLREIAPMGGIRSTRLETDANLNRRKGDAEKANGSATKSRIPVAEDLKQRQAVGKAHRENSDAVNNLIEARTLQTKQGITVVPDKNIAQGITTKQRESSIAGAAAAKNHATASAGLTKTNKHISGINETIKTTADDQVKQNALRDNMVTVIPREKINAGKLDDARRDLPPKLTKGTSEGDIAAGGIKDADTGLKRSGADLQKAKDNYKYFNDPLDPARKTITQNTKLSTAAGNDGLRSRDIFTAAADTGSKRRNAQAQADTGRQQSAKDAATYTRARDDAVIRKDANDTALSGIQKKHQDGIDAMISDTNGAVKNNKKNLDDTNAAGVDQDTKASTAAKARSDKDAEALTQGAATASKLKEVNTARTNEGSAKKASDDDINNVNTQQGNLNKLVGGEPALKADRDKALSTAEASKPVRKPSDAVNRTRKEAIDGTELPDTRKTYDNAFAEYDRLVDRVVGPGGLEDQRYFGDLTLGAANIKRMALLNKDISLRGLSAAEKKRLSGIRLTRDGIGESVTTRNKSILRDSEHFDKVNIIISSKKATGFTESPAKLQHDIIAKQTTAGNIMTTNGRQHVISKKNLDNSTQNIKGVKASIDDNAGGKLSTQKKELEGNISRENNNRQDRMGDVNGGGQQVNKLKKNADDASDSANTALKNQKSVKERAGGIDDLNNKKGAAAADIDTKKGALKSDIDNAGAAGNTAAGANSRRNITTSDLDKIKLTAGGYDANRKGQFENARKYQGEADAARQRKIGDDSDLDAIKSTHQASIAKMNSDANKAVSTHKKGVDDASNAASGQYMKAKDAGGKRKGADEDVEKNKKNIDEKTNEVDKARENELAAKQKNDTDTAAVGTHQKNLDAANLQEGPLKKNRDDAAGAANDASPTRSSGSSAKKQRQADIDGEIGAIQKQKDNASDAKATAADGAKGVKAEKDALPGPDDTTNLKKQDKDLQKKRKEEQENHDKLQSESKKNKKHIEESDIDLMKKQIIAGTVSSMILDMIYNRTTIFDPPPVPLYISGAFVYTVAKASGSVVTVTSGPAGPTELFDLSGEPETVPEEIDTSSLGNIGPMGPITSGASGASGASGVSDYTIYYTNGKVAGTQDGTRDGTSDATNVFLNGKDRAVKDLENKIGMLEYLKQTDIDKEADAQSNNAYCRKVEDEGTKQKLDIYTVFSECSAYFKKNLPMASQPIVLEKLSSSTEESGASESGAQQGGYIEDLSGVMQFGGDLTHSSPDPVDDNDLAYMNGYRAGYKTAYTSSYSLTFAIKLTQKVSEKKSITASAPIGFGEALEKVINASMPKKPITEASVRGPNVSGAMEGKASGATEGKPSGAVKPKIITEASASKSITSGASGASWASGAAESNIITEASANNPNASGANASGASGANASGASGAAESIITEASANNPNASGANASGASGPSQVGGFTKLAKRSYQRGKTLTQHAHLLNKIKGKTSVA